MRNLKSEHDHIQTLVWVVGKYFFIAVYNNLLVLCCHSHFCAFSFVFDFWRLSFQTMTIHF